MPTYPDSDERQGSISRRGFLGSVSAVGGLGVAAHFAGSVLAPGAMAVAHAEEGNGEERAPDPQAVGAAIVPFDGPHQAGVETPPPAHLNVVGFNLKPGVERRAATRLMRLWTEDARRLTQGQNPLGSLEPEMTTTPSSLTITCGLGARFFTIVGREQARPKWMEASLEFSNDALDPKWGNTDIALQICCDDPLTLAFATRHMVRAGMDYAQVAWMQQGFLNAKGVHNPGETPRNLFGHKDGTVNPRGEEAFDEQVWIGADDDSPTWLRGGSCLIVRRIAMHLDRWEALDRQAREIVVGRTLTSGAPLGKEHEFDEADFQQLDANGLPAIDPKSHMALAHPPSDKPEQRLLRRAYNYDLPLEPGAQELSNAGLVFCCYQKDPTRQFIPIQRRLNEADRLNEWITHVGSAMYAVVPGTEEHGRGRDAFWAASMLQS